MRTQATVGPTGRLRVPHDTLIVVCDGETSLFFKNVGSALEPRFERFDSMERPNPRNGQQVADRPGRFNDGPGVQRSAVAETDHHALEKRRFARLLADVLHQGAHAGAYEDLVLVAPPQVLGELRASLHQDVQKRLRAEVDKELTKHPVKEIERIVLQT